MMWTDSVLNRSTTFNKLHMIVSLLYARCQKEKHTVQGMKKSKNKPFRNIQCRLTGEL